MKWSQTLIPTLKESPSDAEIASHQLMVRAGLIRKVASGVYTLLPLGLRVIRKVEAIIREEMEKIGAVEVSMPMVIPASLWQESGRWEHYGPELLRFSDRHDNPFCMGPTHEEVVVDLIKQTVKSYRQLPLTVFQIQTKFRDEIRPRFGLMRAREFSMKDAYSFHETEASLDDTYQAMYRAYCAIFDRCGLAYRVVTADSGSIGGDVSAEFSVLADTGEDALVVCTQCDYAANQEAAISAPPLPSSALDEPMQLAHTPSRQSIDDVAQFLECSSHQMIKTMVVIQLETQAIFLACCPGNREINPIKLTKEIGPHEWMTPEMARQHGIVMGYVGPAHFPVNATILVDQHVLSIQSGVMGSNQVDHHYISVNPQRDLPAHRVVDITSSLTGDPCHQCHGQYRVIRGIETGHIFKLGTTYSNAMAASFADSSGNTPFYIMGCYGIGVGRTVAAAIEQHHDAKGILWPPSIAPYMLNIVVSQPSQSDLITLAHQVSEELMANGIDSIIDDRSDSMGIKFKDAELIGFPFTAVIGKSYLESGMIELKYRKTGETRHCLPSAVLVHLKEWQSSW